MSQKRKRVVLSIEKKCEIIKKLENGESAVNLARLYNVGKSTISDIKMQKHVIEDYVKQTQITDISSSRKTLVVENKLNLAVFQWFLHCRDEGIPVNGPVICEKAREFNEKLNGDPNFKASNGWLSSFKSRHGIRGLDISGEKLPGDNIAAENFKQEFNNLLIEEGYDLNNIYNADETSLVWKSLPRTTLVSRRETTSPGRKVSKDRITVLVCANSTGSHQLPVLIIGKSEKPRCFTHTNMSAMPFVYMAEKNMWMNRIIFNDWFENYFIPEVRERQMKNGCREKTLLLVNNAASHTSSEILNKKDEFIKVKFLPPNVISIIQPMDQGVIECLKRLYKKNLLQKFLLNTDVITNNDVIRIHKKLNLEDCSNMIANAWLNVKNETLRRAWHKLLQHETVVKDEELELSDEIDEIIAMLHRIPGCEDCDKSSVIDWYQLDISYNNRALSSDDFTLENILNKSQEVDSQNEMSDSSDEDIPSHSEALKALETGLRWFEVQSECNTTDLLILRKLCDLAANKKCGIHQNDFVKIKKED